MYYMFFFIIYRIFLKNKTSRPPYHLRNISLALILAVPIYLCTTAKALKLFYLFRIRPSFRLANVNQDYFFLFCHTLSEVALSKYIFYISTCEMNVVFFHSSLSVHFLVSNTNPSKLNHSEIIISNYGRNNSKKLCSFIPIVVP